MQMAYAQTTLNMNTEHMNMNINVSASQIDTTSQPQPQPHLTSQNAPKQENTEGINVINTNTQATAPIFPMRYADATLNMVRSSVKCRCLA